MLNFLRNFTDFYKTNKPWLLAKLEIPCLEISGKLFSVSAFLCANLSLPLALLHPDQPHPRPHRDPSPPSLPALPHPEQHLLSVYILITHTF